MSDGIEVRTDSELVDRILTVLKSNAKCCGTIGEGEYRGAMLALNRVERMLWFPETQNVDA